MAQFGDVSERRRWRKQRGTRSGSDLPIGELPRQRRQRLSHNRKSATSWHLCRKFRGQTYKLNIEMWLSLVERHVRDVEAAGSNPVISTKEKESVNQSLTDSFSLAFRKGFEGRAVQRNSPGDCFDRERPSRAVRGANRILSSRHLHFLSHVCEANASLTKH